MTMTPEAADETRLTEYLLGRLPAEDQSLIEEQYFADATLHERLRAAERDLIDRYVRGELADRAAFERHFLSSPSRRARVEFARALLQANDRSAASAVAPTLRPSAGGRQFSARTWQVAAAVSIVVGGLWFMLAGRGPNPTPAPDQSAAAVQPAQPPPPAAPAAPPEVNRIAPVATFLLVASAVRSTGSQAPLAISPGTDLALQLALEESGAFDRYRVVVRTADGREIWRDDRLSLRQLASGPGLVVTLPSARLTDGDFAIRVAGITARSDVEELSGYSFTLRIR